MVAEAYLVRARNQRGGRIRETFYAAMADTPQHAEALVANLVAPGTILEATGELIAEPVVRALLLRYGSAKLI